MDFFKKMVENPTVAFVITVIAGFLAFIFLCISAYLQRGKALKDSRVGAEREANRVEEHKDLQNRSNEIIESAKYLIEKQNESLSASSTVIQKQNELIDSQKILLEQQSNTLREITGGDGVPRLFVRIFNGTSSREGKIEFRLENKNDLPVRSCFVYFVYKVAAEPSSREFENISLNDLPVESSKVIRTTSFELKDGRLEFDIVIYWLKGWYRVQSHIDISGGAVKTNEVVDRGADFIHQAERKVHYFRLENNIGSNK
ncbi:hypothetical protein [Siphonobacter aquaeclarae]|uniref:Uncharacterized protein n=1 Tax=Siphonobacter aquaeclarae TaxID=563176 RepID=A0A1G9WGM2_9BACT|nr:hypothetical protein [Siphonobacter aquaeclarae]SDM83467.1 hypothetical protein SAMN04488090_4374 [Siphonobacter aquaeclarae]